MTLALALLTLTADPQEPKEFVQGFLETRFTKEADLAAYLGKEIVLLPGHEYLKKRYGLTDNDDRDDALTVESKRFLEVNAKLVGSLPDEKLKKLRDGIPGYGYEVRDLKPGINVLGGPGGRIRFTGRPGDKAVFVRPKPKGDFLLYILRKAGEKWLIVAEYLD